MKAFLAFIRGIDFYGKAPIFYFKGKTKKITIIGRIFTLLIIILYIIFFVYKLKRLFSRVDLSFYDYYKENENIVINITKEDFYFTFGFFDVLLHKPLFDETIISFFVYFKGEPVEVKPCTIDNFGSHYAEMFDNPFLDNFYCPQKFDYSIHPYIEGFDIYMFYHVKILLKIIINADR